MDVDEALQSLGKWGRWQVLFYVIIGFSGDFPSVWHMLAIVFIGKNFSSCVKSKIMHM